MSVVRGMRGISGVYEVCICLALGGVSGREDWFGFYQSCGNRRSVGRVSVFGLRWCGWGVRRVWKGGVVCVSSDYLCRWQVQVSVYCAWRILAHLRCTQYSILVHLMDICFLQCICLWQILQIQTCLCVFVGPGFVSTSPTFMRSSASHPGKSGTHCWGREVSIQFVQQFVTTVTAPPIVGCVVWSHTSI